MPSDKVKKARLERAINCARRSIAKKYSPYHYCFASINLYLRTSKRELDENQFQFILANAVQLIHGEFANSIDILKFNIIDNTKYRAIIRFKTVHFVRITTSLLLFGQSNEGDCRFEIIKTAQSPCFLSV